MINALGKEPSYDKFSNGTAADSVRFIAMDFYAAIVFHADRLYKRFSESMEKIGANDEWFEKKLNELDVASRMESEHIKVLVSEMVPTYKYETERQPVGV